VAIVMPNTPGVAHVILAVTDNGLPALTSYTLSPRTTR
jgi:hypothetical protein